MEAYCLAHFLLNSEKKTKLKNNYFARRKTGTSNGRIIHGQPQWVFFSNKVMKMLISREKGLGLGLLLDYLGFFLTFLLCRKKLGFSSW